MNKELVGDFDASRLVTPALRCASLLANWLNLVVLCVTVAAAAAVAAISALAVVVVIAAVAVAAAALLWQRPAIRL